MSRRTVRPFAAALLALTLAAPAAALAQDPVIKPTPTPSSTPVRLPRPSDVAARQLPDGTIELRWSPLAGADSYRVERSVPGIGNRVVTVPGASTGSYLDRDVVAGRTYYYLVAGLNAAGIGIKGGPATPVAATRSAGASSGPPRPAAALTVSPTGGGAGFWLNVPGPIARGTIVEFERMRVDAGSAWEQRPGARKVMGVTGGLNSLDSPEGLPDGARVQWRVFLVDSTGARSAPTLSNVVTIGATPATTTAAAGAAAGGQVLVGISAPATVRVGGTHSLAAAGTGLRWISLAESVATVDASGTASARAAGTAQLVGVGRAADGAVRVTVVQLTVTP